MTIQGRERVQGAIARTPIDRIPMRDGPWEDTAARWEMEGFPRGADLAAYFDWDMVGMSIDLSMRLPRRLIADDGEYRTIQDRYGYTVRHIKGKSRTFECLDHVTRSREAWEGIKGGFRLDPSDTARIDDRSSFLRLEEYPDWAAAKGKFDRLRFFGNIDAHAMSGPEEALEAEIRDKITAAKKGGGYMFHSDHSIPPEVSLPRYRLIMELVRSYGAY